MSKEKAREKKKMLENFIFERPKALEKGNNKTTPQNENIKKKTQKIESNGVY